jgi:hypothetical protein
MTSSKQSRARNRIAIEQPAEVDVNPIVIRPTARQF